jgi:hypothetical protein
MVVGVKVFSKFKPLNPEVLTKEGLGLPQRNGGHYGLFPFELLRDNSQ